MQTTVSADVTITLENAADRQLFHSALNAYFGTATPAQQTVIAEITEALDSVSGAT